MNLTNIALSILIAQNSLLMKFCLLFLIKLCNFKAEEGKHTDHKGNKPWQTSRDMLCYTLHSALITLLRKCTMAELASINTIQLKKKEPACILS